MASSSPSLSTSATNVYSRSEVASHNTFESCWTIIHNRVYDITDWVPNHPGGDLIRQGAGSDCSAMFEASHPPNVNKMLGKYCIGELKKEDQDDTYTFDTEFWTVLKSRVWNHMKKNNISRHDRPAYYFKTFLLLFLFFTTYYLGFLGHNMFFAIIASITGPLCAICIMHDGQHGAASKYPVINHMTGWLVDFFGASGFIWKHEHNMGHHQHTNTYTDPDAISGDPWVRLSPLSPRFWYHQYQHIYVWLVYGMIMVRWYFADYSHYFTKQYQGIPLYPPSKTEIFLFWLGKIVYMTYTFVLPTYFHGLSWGILCYFMLAVGAGYSFAFQFTVNHLTPDVYWAKTKPKQLDWAKMQIMTSTNYDVDGVWASILSGGLNFQIEHHLFPTICHTQYRTVVSPIVRQTCKEFDVPYNSFPTYWDAISAHYTQLKKLGQMD